MEKIVVFDFFCGCGGTSSGFQKAGMDIVWALDDDRAASETFRRNFPGAQFVCEDIDDLRPEMILPAFSKYNDRIRLFCGCAPCQPFTRQTTRRKEADKDARFNLLISFSRIVEAYVPELVFVENVPGVQNRIPQGRKSPFGEFLKVLDGLEYRSAYGVVAAQDYGAAQMRRRFIFMASRVSDISLPKATHGDRSHGPGLKPYVTVRQCIEDLPEIKAGESYRGPEEPVSGHRAGGLSEINLKRIRATPHDGGNRLSWPRELQLRCHTRMRTVGRTDADAGERKAVLAKHQGHTDVYGRLWWDRPAPGLTTKCISYSNGRFGHPSQDRALSIREAARLQGFPDEFSFSGSLAEMARQIGNAVPIPLAAAVGRQFVSSVGTRSRGDG